MVIDVGGGIELLRSTSLRRKRIALLRGCLYLRDDEESPPLSKTLKRPCSLNSSFCSEKSVSPLENLPQDILITILCGVEHDDLKQLLLVSKAVKEAALIAKEFHFAFCTPRKLLKFPNADTISSEDIEPPNAPKRPRVRFTPSELSSVAVALFAVDEDHDGKLPSAMEMDED